MPDSTAEHPAPESTAAGRVVCPQCSRVSGTDRKFCAGCGTSLWEPCIRCETPSPVGEKFCGTCGTNLPEAYATESAKVEQQLALAGEMQADCRFVDAQRILRTVGRMENKRLRPLSEKAQRLAEEFEADRKWLEESAASALETAQGQFDAQRYAEAVETLEGVPDRLRTPPQEELLATARRRVNEGAALLEEIKADVAANRYLDLVPKAQRLLEIEPNNATVAKLLNQLGKRLVDAARERFAAFKYDEAQTLLDATPDSARDDTYEKLRQEVTEVAWLSEAQRTMPFADATLTAISQRLVKLVPGDAAAMKIHKRLEQCLAAARQRDGRLAPPSWAKPPVQTAFGCPVDPLYGFRALKGPGATCAAVKESPAQFYVAAGLALAALDRAAVKINLLPSEEESTFARFMRLDGDDGISPAGWGIDLTVMGLKAVRLVVVKEKDGDKETLELADCIHIQPAAGEPRPMNEIEVRVRKETLLKKFLDAHPPAAKDRIAVGLTGTRTLGRFVELPPVPADKIADAVRYEAPHQIPFPLDQLLWSYCVLGEAKPAADAPDEPRRIVLLAAKQHHTEEHLSLFTAAGLKPRVLQGDCVALHNYLVHDQLDASDKDTANSAAVLIDIGHDCTNFVFSTPTDIWFRTIPLASGDLTATLTREFKLTTQQAEQLKRQPALARRLSRLYEVFDPFCDQLCKELDRTLTSYAAATRGRPVRQVFGAGGGFQLAGLLRRMRQTA